MAEKRFEYPDITRSDVAFRAYGKTLAEMFENSGLAMEGVTVSLDQIKQKASRRIKVRGNDLKSLMFEFLTELIYLTDAEGLVFSKFKLKADEKSFTLEGEAWGEEIDPKKHKLGTHVKACTYHKMEVGKKNSTWTAQVILDI